MTELQEMILAEVADLEAWLLKHRVTPHFEENPKLLSPLEHLTNWEMYDEFVPLRLDWELDITLARGTGELWDNIRHLMCNQAAQDIEYLITEGDKDADDPTLRVMNGINMTGKVVDELRLSNYVLYEDLNIKKETVEYTLYFVLKINYKTS